MKKILVFAVIAIGLSFTLPNKTEKSKGINWLTFEEAIALNAKNPKPIFFDMYTDWCGWCKQMDKKTFSNPAIIKYMNKNFYAVKFNAETRKTITYKGEEYKNNRGYNELAITMMNGQMAFPTSIFWNEKETLLTRIPSYLSASEFEIIMHYYGDGAYFKTGWYKYKKNYGKNKKAKKKSA
jgi:thioredoxin-related protein